MTLSSPYRRLPAVLALLLTLAAPAAVAQTADTLTQAEQDVRALLAKPGTHVVHFWAPWCPNSSAEMEAGWADLVAKNPEVSFTFVTVWNNGKSGADVLAKYGLTGKVTEVLQPDLGPSTDKELRRKSFLGLPVTWLPATWIYHKNGRLAFVLNHGEADMATLQQLLDATRKNWSR